MFIYVISNSQAFVNPTLLKKNLSKSKDSLKAFTKKKGT